MTGAPGSEPTALPPLVLTCRTVWRAVFGGGALGLFALGVAGLARERLSAEGRPAMLLLAGVLLVVGAGCAHFFLRYGTARLVLDDDGFRLEGPLLTAVTVRWAGVTEYRVRPGTPGPATLTLTRAEGDRLTVPLIYEEAYLLELGLGQRGFPRF